MQGLHTLEEMVRTERGVAECDLGGIETTALATAAASSDLRADPPCFLAVDTKLALLVFFFSLPLRNRKAE